MDRKSNSKQKNGLQSMLLREYAHQNPVPKSRNDSSVFRTSDGDEKVNIVRPLLSIQADADQPIFHKCRSVIQAQRLWDGAPEIQSWETIIQMAVTTSSTFQQVTPTTKPPEGSCSGSSPITSTLDIIPSDIPASRTPLHTHNLDGLTVSIPIQNIFLTANQFFTLTAYIPVTIQPHTGAIFTGTLAISFSSSLSEEVRQKRCTGRNYYRACLPEEVAETDSTFLTFSLPKSPVLTVGQQPPESLTISLPSLLHEVTGYGVVFFMSYEVRILPDNPDITSKEDQRLAVELHAKPRRRFTFEKIFALTYMFLLFILHLADYGTDVYIAFKYYKGAAVYEMMGKSKEAKEEYLYFLLTVTFVVLPSLLTSIVILYWDNVNLSRKRRRFWIWIRQNLPTILQVSPSMSYIEALRDEWNADVPIYALKVDAPENAFERAITREMRWRLMDAIEVSLECFPQLFLQLHIVLSHWGDLDDRISQSVSIASSIISLALFYIFFKLSYRESRNRTLTKLNRYDYLGYFTQFFWHFFVLVSRSVAIVLFTAKFRFWGLLICGVHLAVMFMWLTVEIWKPARAKFTDNLYILGGFAFLFDYLNTNSHWSVKGGKVAKICAPRKLRARGHFLSYFWYYFIICLENAGMIFVWYLNEPVGLFREVATATVLGGTLVGVFGFMIPYYLFLHRSKVQRSAIFSGFERDERLVDMKDSLLEMPIYRINTTRGRFNIPM